MALSSAMRRLENKWNTRGDGNGWPQFLEWIQIKGVRGWDTQKIEFPFPIVAIVGENGSGKSTILQCAASVYKAPKMVKTKFASDYFPDTVWDTLEKVEIIFSYKEGKRSLSKSIRKPSTRWRGNPERPERNVEYIDLSRIQPVPARAGYRKLANPLIKETGTSDFGKNVLDRLSQILGTKYNLSLIHI